MDGFMSLLIFAVLFFVMMRFGCGAHVAHGRHSGHGTNDIDKTKQRDPVCGKLVNPNEGYSKMQDGHLYRFCSKRCLDVFEVTPRRYVEEQLEVPS